LILCACPPATSITQQSEFDCVIHHTLDNSWWVCVPLVVKAPLPSSRGGLNLHSVTRHAPAVFFASVSATQLLVEHILGSPNFQFGYGYPGPTWKVLCIMDSSDGQSGRTAPPQHNDRENNTFLLFRNSLPCYVQQLLILCGCALRSADSTLSLSATALTFR
jgi:hypothetical protein